MERILHQILKFPVLLFLIFLFAIHCNSSNLKLNKRPFPSSLKSRLTGFNINWSFLPSLNNQFIKTVTLLKPKIIRYPGGTISNFWNWEKGLSDKYTKRKIHKIDDLLKLKNATGADVSFVLNIVSSSFQEQLRLLKTAQKIGIPVKYIELGNEQYLYRGKFTYNKDRFPTGADYGKFANTWAEKLKKEFPDVKIGIVLLGRTSKTKKRLIEWNRLVLKNIKDKNFDAFIYHIYFTFPNHIKLTAHNIDSAIKKRISDFNKAMVAKHGKEIWITEYGVHTNSEKKEVAVTKKLADKIESIANISMAHILYIHTNKPKHNFFSMLEKDGEITTLTKLGEMFRKRVNSH